MPQNKIKIADLAATGTKNSTTFLRGDDTFAVPSGGGSPGGSNTQIQFNDSSAFGGVANLTFNNSTGAVTFAGSTNTKQIIVKANATQGITNPLIQLQDSAGTELASINAVNGNVSFGYQAAKALTSGVDNVVLGNGAGGALTSQNNSVTIGAQAYRLATTAASGNSVVIGAYAGYSMVAGGSENTFIGTSAGQNATAGTYNTFIGSGSAGSAAVTGASGNNTFIGASSGYSLTSGTNNIGIGKSVQSATSGTYNIVIGNAVSAQDTTASNQLKIGEGLFGKNIYTLSTSAYGLGIDASTSTTLLLRGSTTAISSLRITSGTAPTSPNNGDIWFDGTDIKMRIGGVTKTFTLI